MSTLPSYYGGITTKEMELFSVCTNCDRIMRYIPSVRTTRLTSQIICTVCDIVCKNLVCKPAESSINNMLARRPEGSVIRRTCYSCGYSFMVFVKALLHSPCQQCGAEKDYVLEMIKRDTGLSTQNDSNENNTIISIW